MAGINGFGFQGYYSARIQGPCSIYFLLGEKGLRNIGTYIQVYSLPIAGFNDAHASFIAYYSTNYNAIEHSQVTSLDGSSYDIEDFDYNGITYRAIRISIGVSSTSSRFYVHGNSSLGINNLLVKI